MSNVPVMQSVRAALEFRRLHWRAAAGALGLAAAGATLASAGDLSGDPGLDGLGGILNFVASIMAYGALLRMAFADEHPSDPDFRPGKNGFQWGKPEWRILGALALILFAFVVAAALLIFLLSVIAVSAGLINAARGAVTPEQVMRALGPAGSSAVAFLVLAFMLVVVWVGIRISLAPAATIARKRISVFDTWPLTKGQFWPIVGATLLVSLPTIGAGVLFGLAAGMVGQPTGPNDEIRVAMPGALLLALIPGLVTGFIQLPLSAGLTAYLFRGLRPPEEAAPVDTRHSDALMGAP